MPKTLKEKIEEMAEATSFSFNHKKEVIVAHALTIIWPFVPEFAKDEIKSTYYYWTEMDNVKLELSTSSDNRDEWKDFYREFRDLGWERVSFTGPTKEFQGIIYNLKISPHNEHLDSLVTVNLEWKISFTNCKIEQTGTRTETITVPIYSINCGGMPEEEAFADLAPEDLPVDPLPQEVVDELSDEDRDCAIDPRNDIQPEDLPISDLQDSEDGVPF